MNHANYRKHNDRTLNSSKYHKLDGTPIRAKLKEETRKEIQEEMNNDHKQAMELAKENYETWGQWVVECYDTDDLISELSEFHTIYEWVEHRKVVADYYKEQEDTAF